MRYILIAALMLSACVPMQMKPKAATTEQLEKEALALMEQGKTDEVVPKLNAILKKNPRSWKALNAIGTLHGLKGALPQADSFFQAADAASPNNAAILNNWALVLAFADRYDLALPKMMQAVERAKPEQLEKTEMNLALLYALMGNENAARMALRRHLLPEQVEGNIRAYRSIAKSREQRQKALSEAAGVPAESILPAPLR